VLVAVQPVDSVQANLVAQVAAAMETVAVVFIYSLVVQEMSLLQHQARAIPVETDQWKAEVAEVAH
jgi:hypothetical protein